MSQVAIRKIHNGDNKSAFPIFSEIARRFEAVKQRAFSLFESRGRKIGHDLEDWLQAEREQLGALDAELMEQDGAYDLQMPLPGFTAKNVEVTATPEELIIHASAEDKKEIKKGDALWTEFGASDIFRRFQVAKPIDVSEVKATYEKGVLHVKAPQASQEKTVAATA